MADRFYLIFEVLAVLFCLHGLYESKFKWNIYVILCMGMELIVYQITEKYDQFYYYKIFIFLMLFLYAKLQFKQSWRIGIINYVLCLVVTTVIQLICYFPIMIWYYELSGNAGYFINILLLFVMLILYKTKILSKIALYIQQEGKMAAMFLATAVLFSIYASYILQTSRLLRPFEYFLTVFTIVILLVFLLQMQKTKLINQQIRAEVDLNKLYGGALGELIDKIRANQHDYKNHLAAMQGMVFTADSLEGLKVEHQEYYNNLLKDDKYTGLLSGNNNPLIAGFLYSKFSYIESSQIELDYSIEINKIDDSLMVFDVVKILGVLIDNAVEEVEKEFYHHKCMEIKVWGESKLELEVGNICRYIKKEEVVNFFQKGNSNKGLDRGLGLYNVQEIVKKWKGEISTENRDVRGENWFYIIIELCINKRL